MSTRALALTCLLAIAAQPSTAAPKGGWAQYKPGTWCKTKTHSVISTAGMNIESTTTTKTTLKDLSATEATLELETQSATTVNGKETASPPTTTTMKSPLEVEASASPAAAPQPVESGEETIQVGGKSYAAKWTKLVTEAGGLKTTAKQWISDTVPGALLKSESSSDGPSKSTMTTELVEFEIQK
jgi:hypothetical protein